MFGVTTLEHGDFGLFNLVSWTRSIDRNRSALNSSPFFFAREITCGFAPLT